MPISVTQILGTDSLSGSRLVINDNFNILASEINAIENYFNPVAGTITNLNDVRTESLRVGLSTVLLDINGATFDILAPVNISNSNLRINNGGLIRNDIDPVVLNDVNIISPFGVGTAGAPPPYTIERVGNASLTAITLELFEGLIGQEIFFMYSQATTGDVNIIGESGNPLILSGGSTLTLNGQGQTAHLLCIDDGTGNGDWYLIGGVGYTIS
jgi:hypothetical protein